MVAVHNLGLPTFEVSDLEKVISPADSTELHFIILFM